MAFIAHIAGDIREGKQRDLQAWLAANERELADSHPAGAKYIGTYFAVYGQKGTGTVHSLIEMESYGTQDALAAAGNDPDSNYGRLINELVEFFDQQSDNWTNALYKSVTSATLYGD